MPRGDNRRGVKVLPQACHDVVEAWCAAGPPRYCSGASRDKLLKVIQTECPEKDADERKDTLTYLLSKYRKIIKPKRGGRPMGALPLAQEPRKQYVESLNGSRV